MHGRLVLAHCVWCSRFYWRCVGALAQVREIETLLFDS
jgi:hypothetical protein